MRIHHVITSFGIGGLENGLVNIVNKTADTFSHEITCTRSSGCMALRLRKDCRINSMNKGDGADYLLSLKFAALLRKEKADIVHARNWGTIDAVIGARLAGIKGVIHSEHGWEATDPLGQNVARRRARQLISRAVAAHVVVSSELRDWLVESGIPERKIHLIPNGVDTDKFCPGTGNSLRAGLGAGADDIVVCAVGRLNKVKDYSTLIRAMLRTRDNVRLVIAGDGPMRTSLLSQIASLGLKRRCTLLGDRDDIPDLLRASDVFVVPSIAEGMSNTLLEAMASGLPIVASRIKGNIDLVQEGRNGFFFAAGDENELAACLDLMTLQQDMRLELGRTGRYVAVQNHSTRTMIGRYERLYEEIMRSTAR